jgi:DNA-binding CsgD family transcriptional regulator
VQELVRLHWQGHEDSAGAAPLLRSQLEAALEDFGASVLTARERQNINLLLRGYSTHSVASELGISQDTVKLHRKNAYAKLGVSSQAELFHMFIDSLRSMTTYVAGDPLVHYLGRPKPE